MTSPVLSPSTFDLDRFRRQAVATIEHDVRIFQGDTIVQPSPSYEGFWARDTMIIALGLIDAGLTGLANRLLRTWANYQIDPADDPSLYVLLNKQRLHWSESDITVPDAAWIHDNRGGLPTSVYVGRRSFPDGTREIYSCHTDPDSTAWWLAACGSYVARTGDIALARDLHDNLQAAMDNLVRRDSDGDLLVEQCPNEDWADHMRRHGKVTYTQSVWYAAVCAAPALGLQAPSREAVRAAIRHTLFTRRGRVLDWRCPEAHSDRMAQDTALLVLHGIFEPEEARPWLDRMDVLASPHGHRVVAPAFRRSDMGPYHFRRGEYQNGAIWTWLTGWEAQSRATSGDCTEALRLIEGCFCPTCDRIYEWIDPIRGDRYNPDFATGAGSILSALARIEEHCVQAA